MRRALHGLIVVSLVLASVAAAPASAAGADAAFQDNVVSVSAGETAEIPVTLADADAAVVTVGDPDEVNYEAVVVIEDGNDDGTVTLRFDTTAAGRSDAFGVAADADAVTVANESSLSIDGPLDAGDYDLAVHPGTDTAADEQSDVATLVVQEAGTSTTSSTTTEAPGPNAGYVDDMADGVVVAPAQNQTITGSVDVDEGTELAVRVRSSGSSPFLKSRSVTAGENGTFSASFDFSGVPNGTEFGVSVREESRTLAEADGRLDSSPPTTTAGDGQPGFTGVLGVLALAGVALLAVRNRA